jgi:hypothetical protein
MAVTETLQIPDAFEVDDNQEDAVADLGVLFQASNLGVLAMLTRSSDSLRAAAGR